MAVSQSKQRGVTKPVISTKLDPHLVEQVTAFAKETDSTRSAAVAILIKRGLGDMGDTERLVKENHGLREKIRQATDALH